jgi:hypothetical protein
VASNQPLSKKIGLTRGKAVLIGVLAVALVGVLYMQLSKLKQDDSPASSYVAPASAPRAAVSRTARAKSVQTVSDAHSVDARAAVVEFDQSKWQSPDLAKVVEHDPFALPAEFPQPPVTFAGTGVQSSEELEAATAEQLADELVRMQTQLDELQQRGVHVVIKKNDQYVAMIGDRMVHVGDDVNGFTVTEIDPTKGVRVEMKGAQ